VFDYAICNECNKYNTRNARKDRKEYNEYRRVFALADIVASRVDRYYTVAKALFAYNNFGLFRQIAYITVLKMMEFGDSRHQLHPRRRKCDIYFNAH
jgi:hypothetical protein